MSDTIKGLVKIKNIRYSGDDWGIVECEPVKIEVGTPVLNWKGQFVAKGNMVSPMEEQNYHFIGKFVHDPKWGDQYDIEVMALHLYVDVNNEESKRKYLKILFTEKQVESMYNALSDPFTALLDKDYPSLIKIKGVGMKNAVTYCQKFEDQYCVSRLITELADYNLSIPLLKRVLSFYKSPDMVLKKIKDNPYALVEVPGIGFSTADHVALQLGVDKFDKRRVGSFILFYLRYRGAEGCSYISTDELMDAIIENIGDEVSNLTIAETIHSKDIEPKLWWNEDKDQIGLKSYYNLEENIKDNLVRLMESPNRVINDNWEFEVKKTEILQGYNFTEEQYKAIEMVMNNNVSIIIGGAGSGKSTVAGAIIAALKNYWIETCALSGRAAARLSEVSNICGKTIHRLLGYGKEVTRSGAFLYTKENKLPADLIIIDEISMVGGEIFISFLEAIKDGAKVVMLGDTGQLEAIGACNVASDMINSGVIPVTELTTIHRQAQKSAIITESARVRKGLPLFQKGWAGTETRGELQDLVLDIYSDRSNTAYKIVQHFKEELKRLKNDYFKIQVIVPKKEVGEASVWNLNNVLKRICNPGDDEKSMEVFYPRRGKIKYHVNDKVINMRNDYKTLNTEGIETPIYNGNIGRVVGVNPEAHMMIVDFLQIGEIVLLEEQLQNIELAYAITVHKEQGSQANTVIMGFDYSSYVLLTRELVYTGMTRAQKKCIVVAQNDAMQFAINNKGVSKKKTHLKKFLLQYKNKLLQKPW